MLEEQPRFSPPPRLYRYSSYRITFIVKNLDDTGCLIERIDTGFIMAGNNVTYWIREGTWPDETHSWLLVVLYIEKKKKKSYNYNIYIFFYYKNNRWKYVEKETTFTFFFFFFTVFQDTLPIHLPFTIVKKEFRSFKGRKRYRDLTNKVSPLPPLVQNKKSRVLSATRLDGPRREAERSRSKRSWRENDRESRSLDLYQTSRT